MTVLHMLDTDTASHVIKKRAPEFAVKLAAIPPAQVCISVITCAELLYGLKRLPNNHRLHLAVHRFLKTVAVLPWGLEAADRYAAVRHNLTTAGQPIGEMDMMIAAHAIAANALLVTGNLRHFARVGPPLAIVDWGSGNRQRS